MLLTESGILKHVSSAPSGHAREPWKHLFKLTEGPEVRITEVCYENNGTQINMLKKVKPP